MSEHEKLHFKVILLITNDANNVLKRYITEHLARAREWQMDQLREATFDEYTERSRKGRLDHHQQLVYNRTLDGVDFANLKDFIFHNDDTFNRRSKVWFRGKRVRQWGDRFHDTFNLLPVDKVPVGGAPWDRKHKACDQALIQNMTAIRSRTLCCRRSLSPRLSTSRLFDRSVHMHALSFSLLPSSLFPLLLLPYTHRLPTVIFVPETLNAVEQQASAALISIASNPGMKFKAISIRLVAKEAHFQLET